MRIGVLEWASCGGAVGAASLPESIRQEGWAMCRAVIESIQAAGHQPVACLLPDLARINRGTGFPARPLFDQQLQPLDLARDVRGQWLDTYANCDATILVAPESDSVLLELAAWCQASGILACISDSAFIECAGDKWLTAQRLHHHQVPHPPTQLLSQWHSDTSSDVATWVLKARDGVGCEGMWRGSALDLENIRTSMDAGDRWIVQPWLAGEAYSRAAIVDAAGQYHWLPIVRQHLHIDQSVSYAGGCVLPELELSRQQADILGQAVSALAGKPRGWIGVDFLLGEDEQVTVIEINPRLTTSFVGLSQACDGCLAAMIVRAALGMEVASPKAWSQMAFTAR